MLLTMPATGAPDGNDVANDVDAPAGSFVGWVLELPPGPESLALLCSLDPHSLTAGERVLVLRAWERQHALDVSPSAGRCGGGRRAGADHAR